jgi:formate dehydrogenase subunit beta
MGTKWILRTNNNPLGAIRNFLYALWIEAKLDGMLLPVYQDKGTGIKPHLLREADRLNRADPLCPFMPANISRLAILSSGEYPEERIGLILHSCEVRALIEKRKLGYQLPEKWITIGVDCLSSFSIEDLEWRLEKAGTLESITRQSLRFARQGGIAPYRFRTACQMCVTPSCEDVDINIELIGLPVKEFILISTKDINTSEQFNLPRISDGPAPISLRRQHRHMLDLIYERRIRCRERSYHLLEDDLPSQPSELTALLSTCTPCQKCLEVCPVYENQLAAQDNGSEDINQWLGSCVTCGMCEQACPKNLPLTALHSRIRSDLQHDYMPIGL